MNQGQVITKTKEQITPAGARIGRQIQQGTVLLSFKLSIGKVAVAGMPLYTNEAIAALPIRDPMTLDEAYLLRVLESMDLAGDSNRAAMGSTLNKAQLQSIKIPLPPLPEQRRIAAILDQADALRAKRREALTHFDSLTIATFHDMFGSVAWPSHPLDSLVDAGDRMNYGVVQPGDESPGGVPLIRVSDLAAGVVDRTRLKHITREVEAAYSRSRLKGTEILVSSVGSIGSISLARSADIGSNIARAITRVPISEPSLRRYVASFLTTEAPQRYFTSELRTVAQPTLNVRQLAATQIPLPPRELQVEFASRIEMVTRQRGIAEEAQSHHETLFSSLQSRAFGGEL